MLEVYLLEDNPAELSQLSHSVAEVGQELKIQLNIHPFASLSQIRQALPEPSRRNVYLLDLEINGDNQAGLKFSRQVRQYDLEASIIFLTVHDELLSTTYQYQVEALDFIVKNAQTVKPSLVRDFSKVVKKLEMPKRDQSIALRSHYEIIRVYLSDILFFQSNPDNTHASFLYTTNNRRVQVNMPLRELEERVDQLLRVHRSYLINPANVCRFNLKTHQVQFVTGTMQVPVSRMRTRQLLRALKRSSQIQW